MRVWLCGFVVMAALTSPVMASSEEDALQVVEKWAAAFVEKPDSFTEKKEIKRLDRFSQFGLVAAYQAVNDSGLDFAKEDVTRCGVILGSGIGGLHEIEEQCTKLFEKGPDRVSPFVVPKMMLNAAGGNISIRYGLRGINYSVATACASANNAIGDALFGVRASNSSVTRGRPCVMSSADATPPVWKVRIVS